MFQIRQTKIFLDWIKGLRDENARARINIRIRRMSLGNPGDIKSVGEGVSEMRVDYGPGYRIYFTRQGASLVLLLCGGNKHTQSKDIAFAKKLAKDSGNDH
jgi:hypothetical protein